MGLGHANNRKITLLLTQHLFTSPRIVTRGEEIFLKIEIENYESSVKQTSRSNSITHESSSRCLDNMLEIVSRSGSRLVHS